jgi:hypothetical protein
MEVGIWLFNLRQCGYYTSRIASSAAPVFGNTATILHDLQRWSSGKKLGETSTFDVPEDTNFQKTYLLNYVPLANGDVLLGMWNRVHSNSNRIASVGVEDIVGAAATEFTDVDETRIPGMATYFWLMPAEGRLATVRVKHMTNGLQNFEMYMDNFVKYINPQHVVLGPEDENEELTISGYRSDPASDDVQSLHGRFSVGSIRKKGDLDFILAHRADIQRVICKTTLTNTAREDRVWWQRGLNLMGMGIAQRTLTDKVKIKVDLPLGFTAAELKATVKEWQEHLTTTDSRWDDLGFVIRGESSPFWLSKSYARKTFDIDIKWIDEEQIEPTALMQQLQIHRKTVLEMK